MRCLFPAFIPFPNASRSLAALLAISFSLQLHAPDNVLTACLPHSPPPYPTLPWQAGRQAGSSTHTATSNTTLFVFFNVLHCSVTLSLAVSTLILIKLQVCCGLLKLSACASVLCLCPLHTALLVHSAMQLCLPCTASLSLSPSLPPSGLCSCSACEWGRTACPNLHHRKFIASVLLPLPHRLLHCLLLLLRLLTRILILSTRHTFFSLHDFFFLLLFVIFISSLVLRFFRFSFHWCNFSAANFCFIFYSLLIAADLVRIIINRIGQFKDYTFVYLQHILALCLLCNNWTS